MAQQRARLVGCLMQSILDRDSHDQNSLPYAGSATMPARCGTRESESCCCWPWAETHTAGKDVLHVRVDDVEPKPYALLDAATLDPKLVENLPSRDIARARKRMSAGCEIRRERTFWLPVGLPGQLPTSNRAQPTTTAWFGWRQQNCPVHSYVPPKTHG